MLPAYLVLVLSAEVPLRVCDPSTCCVNLLWGDSKARPLGYPRICMKSGNLILNLWPCIGLCCLTHLLAIQVGLSLRSWPIFPVYHRLHFTCPPLL